MARSSLRSSLVAALAATVAMSAVVSAHRRDEYLQAARISVDRDRVQIELDLTAGISVADEIIRDLDRDGSGSISSREARMFALAAVKAMRVEIDHRPVDLRLVNVAVPDLDVVRRGEGAIRLELGVSAGALPDGPHQLFFLNTHRPEISVYLANALVPISSQVAVTAQRRDAAQREITVEYLLSAKAPAGARGMLPLGAMAALALGAAGWLRQRS